MISAAAFPIITKWPAQHPERLQLYSLPTPNGVKVSIMLEEVGLAYEAHKVSFDTQDQLSPEFLSLNPNNKIPAIIDPNGPGGEPLALFESGAILIYLAEKTAQLLPQAPAARYETLQWLMFQMAGPTKTSALVIATRLKPGACWASWKNACWAAAGSWAMSTPSPISRPFPGSAT